MKQRTIAVFVNLAERSYPIYIGSGLLATAGRHLASLSPGGRALLVTNPKVRSLYGEKVEKSLREAGFQAVTAEVPDGEEAKSLAVAEKLYDLAYAGGLDRQSPVIALGGGVVGDLAGFVAATYMRGVPFTQLPTTLLAQVDSSVGGKVAVNHPRGKNIIGAFYQPKLVLADPDALSTLEPRELKAGLAEVIKYGAIADAGFFAWLEANLEKILAPEPEALAHAVAASCRIKAQVVEEDETEQGRRAILNFGHTVGHALEAFTGYAAYRHGEAVAVGMAVEARIAVAMGVFPKEEAVRLEALLRRAGLPVAFPAALRRDLTAGRRDEFLALLQRDKKARGGKYTFALPVKMGRAEVFRDVPEEIINSNLLLR
ncbi:MAG: 3-dehydroquinate synthase [Armatimonadetes bacterium]|nr:3-dehydroquinate synthase [Armatimonadota bacterium]